MLSTGLVSFIGFGITMPTPANTPINTGINEQIVVAENTPTTTPHETTDLSSTTLDTTALPTDKTAPPETDTQAPPPTTPTPTTQPTPKTEAQPEQAQKQYNVLKIVDGDTIKISMDGTEETLRLIGIDTPETVDPRKAVQCFGAEASNKAKELLTNRRVTLEFDTSQGSRDKYGRLLAYIRRDDGLFYNKHMIEEGYAHEYTYNLPYKYQTEFKSAQKAAQTAQKGLWSSKTCNGDTEQAAVTTAAQPKPSPTTQPPTQQATGKFYTSSHSSSKYYYPAACTGWQSLSTTYLKSYDTLAALLKAFPNRTLSPQCP